MPRRKSRPKGALLPASLLAVLALFPGPSRAAGPSTHVYGFFDLEAEAGNKNGAAERWTFDQHHLTVVTHIELDETYRVLFETSYEHGPEHGSIPLGKIYIPKVYFEYFPDDRLRIRAGKFLPPFGIYNERHDATPTILPTVLPPFGIYNERHDATPTILPTVLPEAVYGKHSNLSGAYADSLGQKVRAFPRFATGLWFLGAFYPRDWGLEYNAYLSNGRGTEPFEKDDNPNKGVGARVVVAPPGGVLRAGVSFYADRNGNVSSARQSALEVDAVFEINDLLLEGAAIFPRFETLDEDAAPSGAFDRRLGYSVMGAYTLFDRLTPFAYFSHYDPDRGTQDDGENDVAAGVNCALQPAAFWKGEVHFHRFDGEGEEGYETFVTSIAVAF